MKDDVKQPRYGLEAEPGERGLALPAPGPVADYCAACGVRAPEPAEDGREPQAVLKGLGWLVLPPRALHSEVWPRLARNAMCADCLASPTPFARALLDTWNGLYQQEALEAAPRVLAS
ncbi:MAG: hypothetical protein ACYDCL_03890 [Myxococcales bacterium]